MRRVLIWALALVVIAAGVTYWRAAAQTRASEAAYPPIGDTVMINGAQVHYVQRGTGPHLILLHGAGGNLRDYTFSLMDRLTDRYTVTAFDRPGHGYTDRVPGVPVGPLRGRGETPAEQVAFLRAAAIELGITDPIVAGHSFGGVVALAWAVADLDNPGPTAARAIATFGGVAMPWPGGLGSYYTVNASPLGGVVTVPLIGAWVGEERVKSSANNVFRPQDGVSGYAEYIGAMLAVRPASFRANVRQVNGLRPHVVTMSARYPDLTLPIEILHGDADDSVPIHVHAQEIIKVAPTARLTPLPGVGHMPHHIDPDAAIATIDRAAERAGLR